MAYEPRLLRHMSHFLLGVGVVLYILKNGSCFKGVSQLQSHQLRYSVQLSDLLFALKFSKSLNDQNALRPSCLTTTIGNPPAWHRVLPGPSGPEPQKSPKRVRKAVPRSPAPGSQSPRRVRRGVQKESKNTASDTFWTPGRTLRKRKIHPKKSTQNKKVHLNKFV